MERQKRKFSIISPVEHASSTSVDTSIEEDQTTEKSSSLLSVIVADSNHKNQFPTTHSKMMENFTIVWLDSNFNNSIKTRDDLFMPLRHIISTIQTFTDVNECVDFVTDITDDKVFMIIYDYPDEHFPPLIDGIDQLHSIYIFNNCQEKHEQHMEGFKTIKGIYTHMEHIYDAIKRDAHVLVNNLTPTSIVSPNSPLNLDELDQSFMYTQLLKEIIIDIEYDTKKAREEFAQFYLSCSATQNLELQTINKFQQCYEDHSPIWWYTKEWFLYSSLNKALRLQDTEIIIKMGFFVQDLHREIKRNHSQAHSTSKLVVYRGQGLLNIDFEKLSKSEGGLFSFNNFLSTSFDREVSYAFADSVRQNHDMTGILFKLEVDPSISSTPFVPLDNISNFDSEAEILFSMHSVFRIGHMVQIDNRFWEVDLTLTSDNDQQLKCVTDYIRNEIAEEESKWGRMAQLMIKMGKFKQALQIYNTLMETMADGDSEALEIERAFLGHRIGWLFHSMGDYSAALLSYDQFFKIAGKHLPPNHLEMVEFYNNTGVTHFSMGNYSEVFLNFDRALQICQESLPSHHPILAKIYNNIALVHQAMSNYSATLSYLEKVLGIQQTSIPTGHPDFAITHNNIAVVHLSMGNYSLALSYYEKTLEIQQKSLPSDHPDLARTLNNIGEIHRSMGNYSNALTYYEKALETSRKALLPNHPNFALIYNNIGAMHQSLGNYSTALSYYEKTLEIQQKSLPSDHPDLARTHNNIGEVHRSIGNYSAALTYYEKALEMWRKTLLPDHPNFALIYNNIGMMHQSLGNYSIARSYYEKTLEIQQKSLSPYHPELVRTYNNIASMSQLNQDLPSTVANLEKTFETQQKFLSVNHLSLGASYNNAKEMTENYSEMVSSFKIFAESQQKLTASDGRNFSVADENIDEANELVEKYFSAISNIEKVLQLQKKSPSVKSPWCTGHQVNATDENQIIENGLSVMSHLKKALKSERKFSSFDDQEMNHNDDDEAFSMDEFSAAMTSLQKVFEIRQKYSPPNDVSLSTNYNNIGQTYYSMGDYTNALSLFKKALDSLQKCSPINQQLLAKTYNNLGMALEGLDRYREALDYVKRAFDTARSALGSNHPETEVYRNHFDQLKRKL